MSILAGVAQARTLSPEAVPDPLRPWVDWVLFDHTDRGCPLQFDTGERVCAAPTRLSLDLDDEGGTFVQDWTLFGDAWALLPGDADAWPQDVRLNGEPATLVSRAGRPALRLAAGEYRLEGVFAWQRLPQSLPVPLDTALVVLRVRGRAVATPSLGPEGRLWLRPRQVGPAKGIAEARLDLKVFRRVIDGSPLLLETRLELEVAGPEREIALAGVLPEGFIPFGLDGALPARLEPDGPLRIQVRPGRWALTLTARHPEYLTEVTAPPVQGPWPGEEVWVLDARNEVRLVKVQGVVEVDPRQTGLPPEWQRFPAYRMTPGETMRLEVVRRGDPRPEPDRLELDRTLWLDFDGGGYTVRDRITGSMTGGWRLTAEPPMELGRVLLDGRPQFITRLPGGDGTGVEVRLGRLDLAADARYPRDSSALPASGWDRDFIRAEARLHLPPGWKLFGASGVDWVSSGWLQQWSLLDLFLVLLIAIAVGRLWGWPWAMLALVTLGLIWHEPWAPRWVWLHILAAVALLRLLPAGRLRTFTHWYRNLSFLALAVVAVPFLVTQVRVGLYPQLAHTGALPAAVEKARAPVAVDEEVRAFRDIAPRASATLGAAPAAPPPAEPLRPLDQLDPDAVIPTGPGLPDWHWTAVQLGWSGPVRQGQALELYLVPPGVNLVLSLLRALLVVVLAWRLWRAPGRRPSPGGAAAAALVMGLAALGLPGGAGAADQDYPPKALLDQLEKRLVEPPECLPQCAQIPRMALAADAAGLLLRLEVHAQQSAWVPLPVAPDAWLPRVVRVDGEPARGLRRGPEGGIWLQLEPGVHQVVLGAELPDVARVAVPLPLEPHAVEVDVEGWKVLGLDQDGRPGGQLQLVREEPAGAAPARALEPRSMPTFVRIRRTLHLDLDWWVQSEVERVAPEDAPVLVRYPLLPGESVTTAGVQVRDGVVLVNLGEGRDRFAWRSALEKREAIELVASPSTSWSETWRLDASPLWHVDLEGISVVHHTDPARRWLPEWRPWPGESVHIGVVRPEGVGGRTITIDESRLQVGPGRRATDVALALVLRSSKGGQHRIGLPEGAELQSVTIDGRSQPVRQDGRSVTLPLTPGTQRAELRWREDGGVQTYLQTPRVDLGAPSVNARIGLKPGRDRWVLLAGGPSLGPAVLFWGVLLVLGALAFALGRLDLTPLRARDWFLLGIGLSQAPVWVGAVVVGWLLTLGLRCRERTDGSRWRFNLTQLALGLLTLVAMPMLFLAVQKGLLGLPEMQVAGNGSTAYDLNWYQDRTPADLPRAWVVSVPLYVYRVAMLAWALWLAFALLRWLRWGWGCFSKDGLWRPLPMELRRRYRKRVAKREPAEAGP
jgi:hypothetical protein